VTASAAPALLEANGLVKHFRAATALRGTSRVIRAVDGVSLHVDAGEVLSVVGESGSGKTTLSRCLLGLEQPTAGSILVGGKPVTRLRGASAREFRRQVQAVFQEPLSSLDPRWTAARTIREALDCLDIGSRAERGAMVARQLEMVGLPAIAGRRPAAMSGGQRQRVAIAAALACGPRLLIADEPVTALDVSAQAQVINLLSRLREELGLAIILVTHNLAVAAHISDRIAVMHRGRIVETGRASKVLAEPEHPYTRELLAAVAAAADTTAPAQDPPGHPGVLTAEREQL
jgi:ABC-type glutathione transport system ATPase component